MRHADQRHVFGEAELFGEQSRRPPHLIHAAAIDGRRRRVQQQLQAAGGFLEHRSRQGREQDRIVPRRDDRRDIADVAPDRAQMFDHRIDRPPRIFRRVLLAGEALFLIVDDDARPACLRDLDQRDAGVVRA